MTRLRHAISVALVLFVLCPAPAAAQLLGGLLKTVTNTVTETVTTTTATVTTTTETLTALLPGSDGARVIVRTAADADGLPIVGSACELLGCAVLSRLDGALGREFLVRSTGLLDADMLVLSLLSLAGIADAEVDAILRIDGVEAGAAPPALLDATPVPFYGATVRRGYVHQPANDILGISAAHSRYRLTGRGTTVAVIDTGVDLEHPVLEGVLTTGYDFTRGIAGGSETGDVRQSTRAVLDGAEPALVNQSTRAVLDQSTRAVLDDPRHAAFGHGTMVAGVVHLVAPRADIMPLKAFASDGSGYTSDVLRAIYYAVRHDADVINMSFSFATPSRALERAVRYAHARRVVTVASAGNDGMRQVVYPAGFSNVIGVAASTDIDTLALFSNFGPKVAWVAAPGEGVVTTYPYGTYAAAWGTSFSAPFAAGTAALLGELRGSLSASQAADAQSHAVWIWYEVRHGRLDVPAAIRALGASRWR